MPDPIETQTDPTPSSSIVGFPRRPFYFDDKGDIVIPDDLTEEEYLRGLGEFKSFQDKGKLHFAKYIAYGHLKFSKAKVDKHLGQLEFDMPIVSQALLILSIPEELRYDNLAAEHLAILAKAAITKLQCAKWAKKASEQNLTPQQLKASIEAGEVVSTETARKQTHGIISIHGMRMEFDIWLRRVGGLEGILTQDQPNIIEIINELAPMAELYAALVSTPPPDARPKKIIKKRLIVKREHANA